MAIHIDNLRAYRARGEAPQHPVGMAGHTENGIRRLRPLNV